VVSVARQWDGAEYVWQADRPPAHRVPVPAVGDHVMMRYTSWSPEIYEVVVVDVQDMESDDARADPNVYDKVATPDHREVLHGPDGTPLTRRRRDPWPIIWYRHLDANGEPAGAVRSCREARIEGSAGWLPLDHERRQRPHWSGGRLVLPQ
jgi:hypothetical protein